MNSKDYVDALYGMVRETESKMQSMELSIQVSLGRLAWALYGRPSRMRILCDGEPLLASELSQVEAFYQDLPELFMLAKGAAKIDSEKLAALKDTRDRLKSLGIEKPKPEFGPPAVYDVQIPDFLKGIKKDE